MAKVAKFLITGATGAIGSAIIPLIVEKKAQAYLLIRGRDREEVQYKFSLLKNFWDIPNIEEWVKPIQGDVERSGLGLSKEDEKFLTQDITHIIHCAGKVKMNLSIEEARHSAIDSTKNILDFIHKCPNFTKLEFVSTVGVAGRTISRLEERYYSEARSYHNTYEQSKAEAEAFLEPFIQDIPTTLHRPSMVVGDSRTGKIIHFQIFYYLCEFLSGKKTFGVMPDLEGATLDIVPCDYVAKSIVESAFNPNFAGKVMHLSSGHDALPLTQLKKQVRSAFQKRGITIPNEINLPLSLIKGGLFLAAPFLSAQTKKTISTLPIFLDYLGSRQIFENTLTVERLKGKGVVLPAANDYMQHLFDYYFSKK